MKKLRRIPVLPKKTEVIWWICRFLLFVWGCNGLLTGYTSEFIQATFAIIFTHLWDMFQLFGGKSFITKYPYHMQTLLNCFICFACVIGTTLNTRTNFTYIDVPEHIFAGYISAAGSFILIDIIQGEKHRIKMTSQALFGLSFGVTILVGWEFYEFTMDRLYGFVMQHGQKLYSEGLTDTMVDLILGSGGALCATFVEAFRRVGIIGGKDRKEIRRAYLEERAEFKREKELKLKKENGEN